MTSPEIIAYTAQDADWVVDRHAALYAQAEGFDDSFGALVRQIIDDFTRHHRPECEHGWIAWQDGQRQGSVFVVQEAPGIAKLRLFLVEPDSRGTGTA